MRVASLSLAVALLIAPAVVIAGSNRVYLVPALKQCPGPAPCPRAFASTYTFDSVLLRTPASQYSPPKKPAFIVDVRGVKDGTGKLFDGTLTLRVQSGRVSLPGFGTLPDDSLLTAVAPVDVPVKGGRGHASYTPVASPNGLISNGGGVEVLDPDGKRLAVTGSQSKP
jgi:hypothetical protein